MVDILLQSKIISLWDKLNPVAKSEDKSPTMWHYQFTPAFPSVWPPSKDLGLIYYVFAYGFNPNLFDGSYVAAPWALCAVHPGSEKLPWLLCPMCATMAAMTVALVLSAVMFAAGPELAPLTQYTLLSL